MTGMFELVKVFHDIDVLKGRMCGRCEFNVPLKGVTNGAHKCRKGHKLAGADDGCDDWRPKIDLEAKALGAVVMSL